MRNYGYACINMGFSNRPKAKRITTNRTMIKRTFKEKGIGYASELALQNVRDQRLCRSSHIGQAATADDHGCDKSMKELKSNKNCFRLICGTS